MERLCGRKAQTILPTIIEDLKPRIVQGVAKELKKLRIEQSVYADKISNPMKPLEVGENVRMKKGNREWTPATVVSKTEFPRSVIVQTDEGNSYRRNFHHLRRTKESMESSQSSDESSDEHKEERNEPSNNRIIKTKSGRTVKPVQRYQAG